MPLNDVLVTFSIYNEIHVEGEQFLPTKNTYDQFENVGHNYKDGANVDNVKYVPTVDHNNAYNHTTCSNTCDCVSTPQQCSSSSKTTINCYMHLEPGE